ncbi:hypothetical protein MXB_121, partial [Myxobolus squamalis]
MDYSLYTDQQLQAEMLKYGLKMCPITKTTRNFIINKLIKAQDGKNGKNYIENEIISPINDPTLKGTINDLENDVKSKDDSFYGIYMSGNESTPTVVRSLAQAVSFAKSSPGSRFRAFKSYEDANFFSRNNQTSSFYDSFSLSTKESDPTSKYPSISLKNKLKLKLLITNNELVEIKEIIELNPKYLITPCDTPTIIHEGFHRNALHVAVFTNRPEVTQFILFMLKNIFWISKFYGFENPCNGEAFEKSERLLDYILNTPDKGAFETPLHIACKYGNIEIVKMLLNEPLMDRNLKNSYNETPFEVKIHVDLSGKLKNYSIVNQYKINLDNCFVVLSQGNSAISAECIRTNVKSIRHILAIFGPTTSIIAEKIVNSVNKSHHDIEINQYYSSQSGLRLLEYYIMNRALSPEKNDTFTSQRLFCNEDSTIEENLSENFSNLNISNASFHTNNS